MYGRGFIGEGYNPPPNASSANLFDRLFQSACYAGVWFFSEGLRVPERGEFTAHVATCHSWLDIHVRGLRVGLVRAAEDRDYRAVRHDHIGLQALVQGHGAGAHLDFALCGVGRTTHFGVAGLILTVQE